MKDDDQSYYQRASELAERTTSEIPHGEREFRDFPTAKLKRVLLRAVIGLVALLAIAYVGDFVAYRYRVANNTALGTVQVDQFYAIQQKAGRTEFAYEGTEPETCVNALFPHDGHNPCWYARRHTEKRVNL